MCSTDNTAMCTLSVVHSKDLVTSYISYDCLAQSIILTPVAIRYKSWDPV